MDRSSSLRAGWFLPLAAAVLVGMHPACGRRAFGRDALPVPPGRPAGGGVSANGRLRVRDGVLVNRQGRPLQLRGMSSHGLQWYPEFTNARALQTIGRYGASVFRVAMYADSTNGGYAESRQAARRNKATMYSAVENALSADLYAIVDWHILREENPLLLLDDALAFFDETSSRYAGEAGVLYEICNEPSGETTWEDISGYAAKVIPVIRKNSPDAVIIVGTPKHSTDVRKALEAPLPFDNILYALHVYTEYVDLDFEQHLGEIVHNRLPLFVTEWGVSSGGDRDHFAIARRLVGFLDRHAISWVNWSLSNKDESYSAIDRESVKLSGWTPEDLSPSGRLVFGFLSQRASSGVDF